jgi:hypothetical protein
MHVKKTKRALSHYNVKHVGLWQRCDFFGARAGSLLQSFTRCCAQPLKGFPRRSLAQPSRDVFFH